MKMQNKTTVLWRGRAVLGAGVAALAAMGAAATASAEAIKAFAAHSAGASATVDHSVWDGLLKEYVVAGKDNVNRVDYAAFKKDGHKALKSYVVMLQSVDPTKYDRPEQFAYWANLYNAKTIDVVLDNYPVKSIRAISINEGLVGFLKKSVGAGGPWKAKILKVSGKELSLDDVEHNVLRPIFRDPRVHYAVNCASIGCPNLSRDALTGANLEAQLDAGARAYINHPRGISIGGGSAKASSIYQWFQSDFGGSEKGVLAHMAKYADADLRPKLAKINSIDSYGYDWDLNNISR